MEIELSAGVLHTSVSDNATLAPALRSGAHGERGEVPP